MNKVTRHFIVPAVATAVFFSIALMPAEVLGCLTRGLIAVSIQYNLVRLARLKDMNAQGCCLVGHPDYYREYGFENIPGLVHGGVPQEVFFALSFNGHAPQGTGTFHKGFNAAGEQNV